ncbi:MAG: hypothetical protein K1X57_17145 [Gemmataceae bacterium]|nr:hypothetical protein [Gemmataceae bacterium]
MTSPEAIEAYRRMGPNGRLQLTLDAIRDNTPALLEGTPEVVRRRFELIRRRNDEFNEVVCRKLMEAEAHDEGR